MHCSAGLGSEVLCCGLSFNSVLYVRLNCKLNLSKRISSERAMKMNKLLSLTFIHYRSVCFFYSFVGTIMADFQREEFVQVQMNNE